MKWRVLLIAAVFSPILGLAQNVAYRNVVLSSGGFPYPTIRVCTEPASGTPCTPLATNIYSDPAGTQPLTNPFTGDISGNFTFYASPSLTYHVQVSGLGISSYDIANIVLPGGSGGGCSPCVNSFNTRSGAVVPASGDYAVVGIVQTVAGLLPITVLNTGELKMGNTLNYLDLGSNSSTAGVQLHDGSSDTFMGITSGGSSPSWVLQVNANLGTGASQVWNSTDIIMGIGAGVNALNVKAASIVANLPLNLTAGLQIGGSNPLAGGCLTGTGSGTGIQWQPDCVDYDTPGAYLVNQGTNGNGDAVQSFPCDQYFCTLVVGSFSTPPCCTEPDGSLGMGSPGLTAAISHLSWSYGGFWYQAMSTNDYATEFAGGHTGTITSPVVTRDNPTLVGAFLVNPVANNLTIQSNDGNIYDAQPGLGFDIAGTVTSGTFISPSGLTPGEVVTQGTTGATTTFLKLEPNGSILVTTVTGSPDNSHTWVGAVSGAVFTPSATPATPYCQISPTAGHIYTCYGSDGTLKISEGSGDQALYSATQTVAKGTATMTTALIASGNCGTTVTVPATGVLTNDVISHSYVGSVGSNPGVLKVNAWTTANNVNFNYCNGTAGSVTPSPATLNWSVQR